MKIIQTLALAAFVVLLSTACSKKASPSDRTSDGPPPNQQNGERRGPQQGGGRRTFEDMLTQMDTNKDNKLSKSEAKGPLQNDFSKIDKDGDGFINAEEFKNAPPPPPRGGN